MTDLTTAITSNTDFVGWLNTTTSNCGYISTTPYTGGTVTYSYPHWCTHPDNKTETAYRVIRALMKSKVVKIKDLIDFFDAMDEVIAAL